MISFQTSATKKRARYLALCNLGCLMTDHAMFGFEFHALFPWLIIVKNAPGHVLTCVFLLASISFLKDHSNGISSPAHQQFSMTYCLSDDIRVDKLDEIPRMRLPDNNQKIIR